MNVRLKNKIYSWERLGLKKDTEGSVLIAHTPRDFPEAYLHSIYSPIHPIPQIDFTLPSELSDFYLVCNGLRLFAGTISIFGFRKHLKRDLSAQFQPFDLVTSNQFENDLKNEDCILIGSYNWDGSKIYIDQNNCVKCVSKSNIKSQKTWSNIEVFLESEFSRIEKLFDGNGYLIDEEKPSTPF